jgi:hypothetical protein
MDEILEILSKNARISHAEIAKLTGKSVDSVKKAVKKYEKAGVILNYKAVINHDLIKEGRPLVRAFALVSVALLAISLYGPSGLSLWRFVYEYIPGGAAVRAVSRLGVMALIPASIGLALAIDRARRKHAIVAFVLAASCLLEQGLTTPAFSKPENRRIVQTIADQITNSQPCDIFFYTQREGQRSQPDFHIDAMLASLATGIPTVNGYSGNLPPEWGLFEINIRTDEDERTIRQALSRWGAQHGIASDSICWIQSRSQRDDDAVFMEQTVPPRMAMGSSSEISLTVKNSGVSTWTRADGYRLGSQAPQDNIHWGIGRVELPVASVQPGETVTFVFNVMPSEHKDIDTVVSRTFRWRMVRDGAHWFGADSDPVLVKLTPAAGR